MCFGKIEKPQPKANPQEEPDPRQAPSKPQSQASSQRPASRRQSVYNPTHQDIGKLPALPGNVTGDGPQPPRQRRPRRARSTSQLNPRESRQPPESGPQRASKRQSVLYQSDRVIIAVMGIKGKIQNLFKICIGWLR